MPAYILQRLMIVILIPTPHISFAQGMYYTCKFLFFLPSLLLKVKDVIISGVYECNVCAIFNGCIVKLDT